MTWLAILLMAGAACLHFLWRRRVFMRTNACGIERYESYYSKLGAQSLDRALRFGSLLLFLAGVLMLSYVHLDSWGWIVLVPVLAFVLFLLL